MSESELEKKKRKLELLKQRKALREGLPFLYRWKWYKWTREFIESKNRMNLLVAANQIGKSSASITKNLVLATDKSRWSKMWDTRPQAFYYVMPDWNRIEEIFQMKFLREFLPQKGYENHPIYGYEIEWKKAGQVPKSIIFKSGVVLYFKSFGQDLQSATLHMVSVDEELPFELYPELAQRLSRYNGIFNMVFTATLNQQYWFDAMEKRGKKGERFPDAAKWQISKFDCMYYEDGTPGPWTAEKIARDMQLCGSETEIQRRIYGRFVSEEGLKYPAFTRQKNVKPFKPIPRDWTYFAGIDYGSGGKAHKSAITIIAVSPNMREGRVVRFWKGEDGIDTTTGDVIDKFMDLTQDIEISQAFYDWNAKDLATYAERAGLPLTKAEKGHDVGEATLNTLFKNDMLSIDDIEDTVPLVNELTFLRKQTRKVSANDDGADSLRYSVTKIPWDFSHITADVDFLGKRSPLVQKTDAEIRREHYFQMDEEDNSVWDVENEIDFWNEQY